MSWTTRPDENDPETLRNERDRARHNLRFQKERAERAEELISDERARAWRAMGRAESAEDAANVAKRLYAAVSSENAKLVKMLSERGARAERAENEARGRKEEQLRQQRRAERAEEMAASWEDDALRLLQIIARVRDLRDELSQQVEGRTLAVQLVLDAVVDNLDEALKEEK